MWSKFTSAYIVSRFGFCTRNLKIQLFNFCLYCITWILLHPGCHYPVFYRICKYFCRCITFCNNSETCYNNFFYFSYSIFFRAIFKKPYHFMEGFFIFVSSDAVAKHGLVNKVFWPFLIHAYSSQKFTTVANLVFLLYLWR